MDINFLAVLVCGILSMAIGMLWYSKILFGNAWCEINGMNMNMSPEEMKAAQKKMTPVYITQFALSLFQAFVLAYFIDALGNVSGMITGFWMAMGFAIPAIAGITMWNGKPKKVAEKMFLISAGYQAVILCVSGLILGMWK